MPFEFAVIASMIFSGGVVFSWINGDWSWFSRFGSLLVVFSATLYAADYKKNLLKRIKSLEDLIDTMENAIEENKDYMQTFRPNVVEKIIENVKSTDVQREIKVYKSYELFAAIVGTLMWGWGDLVDDFYLWIIG